MCKRPARILPRSLTDEVNSLVPLKKQSARSAAGQCWRACLTSTAPVQNRRKDLVHTAAMELDRDGLLRYDRKSGRLQATDLGRIASQYYITHTTLREFNEHLKPTMGEIELLKVFCLAEEFKYMVVRDEEKPELVRLMEKVPIPIKDGIDDPAAKINVLIQVRCGRACFMALPSFAAACSTVPRTSSLE